MAAHNLPISTDRALRNGFYSVADPGASGTISWHNKGLAICEVVTATAESRALPTAAAHAVGTHLIVTLKTDGGDLSITGATTGTVTLDDAGEVAEFVVTDANGTHQWHQLIVSTALTSLTLADDVAATFGTGSDVDLLFSTADASNHAFVIALDNTSQQLHITDVGAEATDWNRSAGTHPEVAIHSNTTPATDYLAIGNHDGTTAHINVVGGTTLSFDVAGTASFTATATTIKVADSIKVTFGTGDDITMAWDGTDFDVLQATANSSIKWGIDGAGIDQVWYGDTASNSMTWDQSADDLVFTAAAGITGAGSNEVPFTVPAAQETIAAGTGGAISVVTHFTSIAADAGGDTATLAAGTQKGQIKEILMPTTAGGTVVVTIATGSGGNTLTMSVAGDFARFYWTGAAWVPIALYNQATGSVATPTWTTV